MSMKPICTIAQFVSFTVTPDQAKEALAHDHGYFSMCPSPCRADVLVHVTGGNERSLSTLTARTTQSHQHRLHGTVCTARTSRKNSKALHKLSSIHPLHFMSDTTPYSRTQKFKGMNCNRRDKEKKAKHRSTEKDRRNASKLILEHLLSSTLNVPGNYLQIHRKFSKSKQVAPKIAILMSAYLTHYTQIKKIRCICNKILAMAPGLKKRLELSGLPCDLQKLEGFVLECDGVLDRQPDLKNPHLLEAIYKGWQFSSLGGHVYVACANWQSLSMFHCYALVCKEYYVTCSLHKNTLLLLAT